MPGAYTEYVRTTRTRERRWRIFFNRPVKYLGWLLCFGAVGFPLLAPIPARSGHVQSALDEWHILRQNLDGRGITLETTNTTDIGSAVNWKGDPGLWL